MSICHLSANCKIADKRLVNCHRAAKRWALLAVVGSHLNWPPRFDRHPASSDGLGDILKHVLMSDDSTTIDF
jgi:hypothetical protein